MASQHAPRAASTAKAPTGMAGLDDATGGGLPRGRATLVEGGPGAGKTVLALQSLVHAARDLGEPCIFVAFEESASRIVANAALFGSDLLALQKKKLFFLDAQPGIEIVQSGAFDLGGLLAALDAKVAQMQARRIAFDAIDVVLSMLPDEATQRRELYRLHAWLLARELTAIITAKAGPDGVGLRPTESIQFMVDCALTLNHRVEQGVSQRSLRVRKYRGSDFHENELPFVMRAGGLEIASVRTLAYSADLPRPVRVSSGVPRLDTMLGGGYFSGTSVLVTGAPGTAKTTLCGAFAEACCQRGDSTLYISFDSDTASVVRNLSSVGIRLGRYLAGARRTGLLRMAYVRAVVGSAETQLLQIRTFAREHQARCLVIDPVSALAKAGNAGFGHSVVERLIDWARSDGITLLCSSLHDDTAPTGEGSPLQISTIADTWIHLLYLVRSGERNRGLSIIKSRGTAHSNQVRELVLSDQGITLADAYSAQGEVLMGTLRWEREQAEQAAQREAEIAEHEAHVRLMGEEAELVAQLAALQRRIESKRADLQVVARSQATRREARAGDRSGRLALRGADAESAQATKRAPR